MSSPWLPELTFHAEDLFLDPYCRIVRTNCQSTQKREFPVFFKQQHILVHIPQTYITWTGSVCTGTTPGVIFQLSTVFLELVVNFFFKTTLLASIASLLPCMSKSRIKMCFAYASTCGQITSCSHSDSFSHPVNLQCSVGCRKAFEITKIRAEVSSTSSFDLQNLDTRSVNDSTNVCSGLNRILFPNCPWTH